MPQRLTRKKTPTAHERIRSLEDRLDGTMEQLNAAVTRLSREMDELQKRDPVRDLRTALQRKFGSRLPSERWTLTAPTKPSSSNFG
jgi:uncharacterized coiled-coil protein SlyX